MDEKIRHILLEQSYAYNLYLNDVTVSKTFEMVKMAVAFGFRLKDNAKDNAGVEIIQLQRPYLNTFDSYTLSPEDNGQVFVSYSDGRGSQDELMGVDDLWYHLTRITPCVVVERR